jgi:hypothetical protein
MAKAAALGRWFMLKSPEVWRHEPAEISHRQKLPLPANPFPPHPSNNKHGELHFAGFRL